MVTKTKEYSSAERAFVATKLAFGIVPASGFNEGEDVANELVVRRAISTCQRRA